MNRPAWLLPLVVLMIVLQSAAAMAQPGRGRRGGMVIDRAAALSFEEVRDELKIDEDQAATIEAAVEAYQEERRAARPDRSSFQFLSDEEQQELREELRQAAEESSRKADETLAALLEPEQLQRLDQLILQAQLRLTPVQALLRRVELTEEQQEKLQAVEEDARERQSELRSEVMKRFQEQGRENVNMADIRKMFAEFQEQTQAAAIAVLTDDQAADIQKQQGEVFEIDLQMLMRGGRRGDRRRGGPDGGDRRGLRARQSSGP